MQPARQMRIAEVPECLRPKGKKKRKKGLKQKKRREKNEAARYRIYHTVGRGHKVKR